MGALDFTEIPSAASGASRDSFELFAREFLVEAGYEIASGPDRGADGGRDLIVVEKRMGCEIPTFPLLVKGATYADVPSPLDERSCLDISISGNCAQCIEAIGRVSSLERRVEQGDLTRIQESTNELSRVAGLAT